MRQDLQYFEIKNASRHWRTIKRRNPIRNVNLLGEMASYNLSLVNLVFEGASLFSYQTTALESVTKTNALEQQGWIHGTSVADGWAGAVMQKPLAIKKCDRRTDQLTQQGVGVSAP